MPANDHLPGAAGPADAAARPAGLLLITGATGTLGRAFVRACRARGVRFVATTRAELDVSDGEAVERVVASVAPRAVVNAAGFVRVDDAERDAGGCFAANARGPARLAEACARQGARLLTFSTDLVFDGRKGAPYLEGDDVAPLNVYGRSKAEAERLVLAALPGALVVRTSAFFGPDDAANFVTVALGALGAGDTFVAAGDAVVSPTYVPDLVDASLALLARGAAGVWHLANEGACTWAELARRAAALAGVSTARLEARPQAELRLPATRPLYSALATARGRPLPGLDDALARYLQERRRE